MPDCTIYKLIMHNQQDRLIREKKNIKSAFLFEHNNCLSELLMYVLFFVKFCISFRCIFSTRNKYCKGKYEVSSQGNE